MKRTQITRNENINNTRQQKEEQLFHLMNPESPITDVEMQKTVPVPVYEHKILINNMSPSIWCMKPRLKIDFQRKQPFSSKRPTELANLSETAWASFHDQLLLTWSLSRNEGLKAFCISFIFFFISIGAAGISGNPILLVLLVCCVIFAASYGCHHSFLRGSRIRDVVAQHNATFEAAGYEIKHSNLCGTVKDVTILC